MEKTVIVMLVAKRDEKKIAQLQKVFTQYGNLIRTRLGIHDEASSEGGEEAAEQGREAGAVAAVVGRIGHDASSSPVAAVHCAAKAARARASRDITVPIGVPMISAISLYEKPSTSAR